MSGNGTAFIQLIRSTTEHQFSRSLTQFDAEIRTTTLYRPPVLSDARTEGDTLRFEAREYPSV